MCVNIYKLKVPQASKINGNAALQQAQKIKLNDLKARFQGQRYASALVRQAVRTQLRQRCITWL